MVSLIREARLNNKIIQRIRRYTNKALEVLNINDKIVTVVFCNKLMITEINEKYFNKPYPTNVISFPLNEDKHLGEIYICVEVANEEAKEWGVSLFFEIMYLMIHGLLHLIGYDHVKDREEERLMEEQEIFLVNKLNLNKWRENDS